MFAETLSPIDQIGVDAVTILTVYLSVVCSAQVGGQRLWRSDWCRILCIAACVDFLTATSVEIRKSVVSF